SYAVKREDMVASSDNWFRPSDVCVAPDGAVFVADWYDPGVGGHGMGDTTRGRIFRVAPTGNRPSVPKVDLSSEKGLTAALASPNRAVRYMAMAKLQRVKAETAVPALLTAAGQRKNPWLAARAIWQLSERLQKRPDGAVAMSLISALQQASLDKDERFRVLAV